MFKVGDKVETTSKNIWGINAGEKGNVVDFDVRDNSVLVEFENKVVAGHSGDGRGKSGHCLWFEYDTDNIKLAGQNLEIGDSVIIIDCGSAHPRTQGQVGKIISFTGTGYQVSIEGDEYTWYFRPIHLKKVEVPKEEKVVFKIGDKVKVTKNSTRLINDIGIVKGINETKSYASVEFKEDINGHTGINNCCRDRHGWNFDVEDLELVREKELINAEHLLVARETEERIKLLDNAILKHNAKIEKINKQLKILKEKRDKHAELSKVTIKEVTQAEIEAKFGCRVKLI